MLRRSKTRSVTDNKNSSNSDKNDKREGRPAKNLMGRSFDPRSTMHHQDTKHSSRKMEGKPKGGAAHQHYERCLSQAQEALSMGDRIEAEHYYQRADHWLRICNEGRKNKEERHNNERRQNYQNRDSEQQSKKSDVSAPNLAETVLSVEENPLESPSLKPSKSEKNQSDSPISAAEGAPPKRQGDKRRMTHRKKESENKNDYNDRNENN